LDPFAEAIEAWSTAGADSSSLLLLLLLLLLPLGSLQV